ncbi:MAG: acyl carrier protein [Bryobacteraceae bacterium]|jgi:acyl carrier protein
MAAAALITNTDKLRDLMVDVFLIDPREFREDLKREDIETWDSLGIVSLAVGVQETFGYHMSQDEAIGIQSVADLVRILEARGISFDARS